MHAVRAARLGYVKRRVRYEVRHADSQDSSRLIAGRRGCNSMTASTDGRISNLRFLNRGSHPGTSLLANLDLFGTGCGFAEGVSLP